MTTFLSIISILAIVLIFILIFLQKKLRKRFELDIWYMSRQGLDLSESPKQSKQIKTHQPTIKNIREEQDNLESHNKYLERLTNLKQQYLEKYRKKQANKKKQKEITYPLFNDNELEIAKGSSENTKFEDIENRLEDYDSTSSLHETTKNIKNTFSDDIDIYLQASQQKDRFSPNLLESRPKTYFNKTDFDVENIDHRDISINDSLNASMLKNPNHDYEVITINDLENFKDGRQSLKEIRENKSKNHPLKNQNKPGNSQENKGKPIVDLDFPRKSISDAIEDYYVKDNDNTDFLTIEYNPKRRNPTNGTLTTTVIGVDEIKYNLLKARSTRRRDKEALSNQTTTIQVEEVFQNLKGSDSPLTRNKKEKLPLRTIIPESIIPKEAKVKGSHGFEVKYNKNKDIGVSKNEPISTKFTPADNSIRLEESIQLSEKPVSSYGRKRQTYLETETHSIESEVSKHEPEATVNIFDKNLASEENSKEILVPYSYQSTKTTTYSQTENTTDDLTHDSSHIVTSNIRLTESRISSEDNQFIHADFVSKDSTETEYNAPNLSLLEPADISNSHLENKGKVLIRGQLIENKLAEFKVKVSVTDAYAGPVVTRYDIEPDTGVRGNQVINLEKDLARALGVASIRIVDTIPGKTCMGLELPNSKRKVIRLSEIFNTNAFLESKSKLTLALGQDITGSPIVTDLAKSPHLLVAGTTGSGKSVGINSMILSMLFKASPDEVRLIMIDPKMLELSIYEGIPHLLAPVVTDMKLAPNALIWCVNEMEKRYKIMSHLGVRNIVSYNQKIKDSQRNGRSIANPFSLTPNNPELLKPFPYIVVIVDEFADLMMTTGKKIEELIARLAQKARAAGIHLILATQRPSVDVITGLIKANIPARIAFQVSSKVDSRTIIDQMGAENLLGMGDMLFTRGSGYPTRVHGAFVADEEVHRVVEYLKQFGEPDYVEDILVTGVGDDDLFSNANSQRNNDGENDTLYDEAVNIVLTNQKASISYVQRALRIGYNRAARLIEQMEISGIVSAPENNGNRTILVKSIPQDHS